MPESFERRIQWLETKVDRIDEEIDDLKTMQHKQELVNQKMDYTLDRINEQRELEIKTREKNAKNVRDIKFWMLGIVGALTSSILFALFRMLLGI